MARHSSLTELQIFVRLFQPELLYPIVQDTSQMGVLRFYHLFAPCLPNLGQSLQLELEREYSMCRIMSSNPERYLQMELDLVHDRPVKQTKELQGPHRGKRGLSILGSLDSRLVDKLNPADVEIFERIRRKSRRADDWR